MVLKSVWNFINYWYFRYLLVTELYMVEKWERNMFHILAFVIFSILSVFNNQVVYSLASYLSTIIHSYINGGPIENISTEAIVNEL